MTGTAAGRPFPWGTEIEETVVLGQPCLTFSPRPTHLADLLLDAQRFPEREYLVQGARRLTFADHQVAVGAAAHELHCHGVRPGDFVMLFGGNSVEWVVAFWAILEAGGVVVLANAWWSEAEFSSAYAVTDPRLVLVDRRRAELLRRDQPSLLFDEITKVLDAPDRGSPPSVGSDEDDAAVVLFTSGTTGPPKGAVLSHRGILATLHALLERTHRLPAAASPLAPVSKALLSLPLFHIGGLQQVINPLVTGGTVIFGEGRFDPRGVVDLIEEEGIAVWSAVPTMVSRVIEYLEESQHRPLTGLRTVGLGGSPVADSLRRRVLEVFPNAARGLAVTYGLSEACGVVATGAGAEVSARPGTVGRPLATTTVRIEDDDDQGVGEVLVRSPAVMLGYLESSEEGRVIGPGPITEERWLRTGDVGWIDPDGYLYITDRSKDIVIRGGENIASPHVEDRLLAHPDVREVAVIGLPHPTLGEEVAAAVVLVDGATTTAAELAEFARAELAYFEVPSRWRFEPESLPKNTTGKIVKHTIRDRWLSELPAARLQ